MKRLASIGLGIALLAASTPAMSQARGGPPVGAGPPAAVLGLPALPPTAVGPPAAAIGPPSLPAAAMGPPGLGGSPPGQSGTAPGLSGTAPGQSVRQAAQGSRDAVGRPTSDSSGTASPLVAQDGQGRPIVRSEVVAVSPSPESLEIARRLRFTVERQDQLGALGVSVATLKAPQGMSTVDALAALKRADPAGTYDYDHLYDPSGAGDTLPAPPGAPRALPEGNQIRVGMVDGGLDTQHPAFRHALLVRRDFAGTGQSPATIHGTAVASLLVGHDGDFSGYLPDASLYAADVFGGAADGGSAEDIARALNWLAANKIAVTNVSLAGPPNALLGAVVKAFVASGHVLVAAAGNGGPAAAPSYPAAYPGVIAVTSVDQDRHLEIDASRTAAQFAALGVDVRAAKMPDGYGPLTGTSFAAPVVTARMAELMPAPDLAAEKEALSRLRQSAVPLDGDDSALRYLALPGRSEQASAATVLP